jgi:hypothetical protein
LEIAFKKIEDSLDHKLEIKVPVFEGHLSEVDVGARELYTIYWEGPGAASY